MISLTIIIPVFNEQNTIVESIKRIKEINIFHQVIIVDDCSTDNSNYLINEEINNDKRFMLIKTNKNLGKGKALSAAKNLIQSDYVVVHDADLEYFPKDLVKMYDKIHNKNLIIGSRFIGKANRKNKYMRTYIANYLMSKIFSILYRARVSDVATCYKMMPSEYFKNIEIDSNGFEVEIEVLAKYFKMNKDFIEVPINYDARSYSEGKKIKAIDGFKYIIAMLRYLFWKTH